MGKLALFVTWEPHENWCYYSDFWLRADPITNLERVAGVLRPHVPYPANRLRPSVDISGGELRPCCFHGRNLFADG
ncbi:MULTISPECIES: hypothetical protein [Mesorhizobium]|uniref:hypothetical protein n=1 Tax=Mesorhizobium sp. TaxID=1871066 RepID=UPI000AE11321|nr:MULTISPECIES: hypothetical protein [Mesorhizobium]